MSKRSEAPIKRTEKFTHLADLCPALAGALQHQQQSPEAIFLAFRNGMSLECAQCGTVLPGEDLYLLSQPADDAEVNPALRRLRLGFCPSLECKSYDCTITFQPGAEVDWTACLRRADRLLEDLNDTRAGKRKRWRSELIRPAIITVSALLLILLLRQLYFGGRIPFIREPEKFWVDPYPKAGTHQ